MKAQKVNPPPAEAGKAGLKRQMYFLAPPDLREHIMAMVERTGRSQAECIEYLLEKAIAYDRMLAAMKLTLDKARREGVERIFRDEGYTPVHSPHGDIWVPPDYPLPRSGFISNEEEK
jgi:hypothetical protein